MYDFLVGNAIDNVWCDPDQNKQFIFELAKLTPTDGVLNTVTIFKNDVSLPLQNVRFHVYQIGALYPDLLNLPLNNYQWNTIAAACNSNNLMVDLYTNSGLELPRFQTWYRILSDGNIIVAVLNQLTINVDLNRDPLFFRLYSNAFFATGRTNADSFIKVDGAAVQTVQDIITIQQRFNTVSKLSGVTNVFINGIKANTIDLISVALGDVVEYVYDGSIFKIVDFPISSLQTFISSMDNKNKYLLHYPGIGSDTIDYQDDIDFFIIQPTSIGRHIGVYYHKNNIDAVRMVTHKDYSLVVPYLAAYLPSIAGWGDINALTIRMHIRKNGYQRNLVSDNNRIKELYNLPDNKIVQAMIGVNSTVPYWTASNLEASSYIKLMNCKYTQITRDLVELAYGYNYISKILGDTPSQVIPGEGVLLGAVPYGLTNMSVVYEYDANGILLGWYSHVYGTEYVAINPNCTMVEIIAGIVSPNTGLDENYGSDAVILDPSADYRFYTTPINNGLPTDVWTDVTDTNAYTITNNVLVWNIDPTLFYTLVRSNLQILVYDLMLIADNGLVSFSLTSNQTRHGVSSMWVMQVPMGELDLFLNGYSLIEGVDYIFRFPFIVIINFNYLQDILTKPQKITIRYTGFCNKDLRSDIKADIGFVEYGLLSYNNVFNLRNDRVVRTTIGGRYYAPNQLNFAETDTGSTLPNILNGMPYSIRDVIVPLRGFGTTDTYTLKAASDVADKAITDYLTLNDPQPIVPAPNVVAPIQLAYSPFCCKLIFDLKNGAIADPRLLQQYNDSVVAELCAPYTYLLPYDPASTGNNTNTSYIRILPHYLPNFVSVNIYQFKFLDRAVSLYLNNAVNLNNFVSVSS